ncbi:MAG: uroporphyrinogen decarboxylase family protein [Armatimonadota bacterium]
MSFQDGWAALNLEMPKRVPRTEYSAELYHFDLMKAATGIDVSVDSPEDVKAKARFEFMKAWKYDFRWATLIHGPEFGSYHTSMGHAQYASDGSDMDVSTTKPFSEPEDVLEFDPWETLGPRDSGELRRRFEEHYRANHEAFPDAVNMTGIYVTLISGLIDLFGWDVLLMAAGIDPEGFGEVANRYSSWIQQYFDALAESDVPVVMVHDDIVWTSGAIFPPEWYRKYVFPNFKKQFAPILDSGKRLIFTSDGTYTEFFDDLVDCGAHGFVLEPTTDMSLLADKYGKTHVFIGNADTRILLSGTKEDIRTEVRRCMDIGKDCPGFFMAVGNHIPPNTPVENALYYNDIYEELSLR